MVSVGAPLNDTMEIGGPEVFRFDDLVRHALSMHNDPRDFGADPYARYFGTELREPSLVPTTARRAARPDSTVGSASTHPQLNEKGPRERMNDARPFIDYANLPAPSEGMVVTTFLAVRSIAKSRAFYRDVLEGTVVLEENPCIVKLANSWIIMNPGGPPTPDKPDISVVNYEPGNTTSIFMNLRVADLDDCYRKWSERGAHFLTPPIDRGAEIRCYMRDPDGYLIEVGQSTGLLSGHLAARRPEDLPG